MEELEEFQNAEERTERRRLSDKILNLMEGIRATSNKSTQRRWIWELIQNAKDSAYEGENVRIRLEHTNEYVKFSHNGDVFTTNDIVSIVEQTSAKDREKSKDIKARITGKYGTGFATTHLLSEKVSIHSYNRTKTKIYKFENLLLDRSGVTLDEIFDGVVKSKEFYLQKNHTKNFILESDFRKDAFNTTFEYHLESNYARESTAVGLQDLEDNCPLLLVFVNKIEHIIIEGVNIINYTREPEIFLEVLKAEGIVVKKTSKDSSETYYYIKKSTDKTTIAIEVEDFITFEPKKQSTKHPKLFCELPLIGSELFPIPISVNSPYFNPNEPRNGLFLLTNSPSMQAQVSENQNILEEAIDMLIEILNSFSSLSIKQSFNILKFRTISDDDSNIDQDWYEDNIHKKIEKATYEIPLIVTESGMMAIKSKDNNISFIKGANSAERTTLYELHEEARWETLPLKELNDEWVNIIKERGYLTDLEDLQQQLSKDYSSIDLLAQGLDLTHEDTLQWYNKYLNLLSKNDDLTIQINASNINVLFDYNGDLKSINNLNFVADFPDSYVQIDSFLNGDLTSSLLNKLIDLPDNFKCKVISSSEIIDTLFKKFKSSEIKDDKKIEVAHWVLGNEFKNQGIPKQVECFDTLCDLLTSQKDYPIYDTDVDFAFPKEWYEYSLDSLVRYRLILKVEEAKSLTGLSNMLDLSKTSVNDYLESVYKFLVDYGYVSTYKSSKLVPERATGDFKSINSNELRLLDEDIDNGILEIIEALEINIRFYFVERDLFVPNELGIELTGLIDIEPDLTKKVKNIIKVEDDKDRNQPALDLLYRWLTKNESKYETKMPDLFAIMLNLLNKEKTAEIMELGNELDKMGVDKKDIETIRYLKEHGLLNLDAVKKSSTVKTISIDDIIVEGAIYTQADLDKAIADHEVKGYLVHVPVNYSAVEKFNYVTELILRSRKRILEHLQLDSTYDLSEIGVLIQRGAETTFQIKKNGKLIWLVCRPSDLGKIHFYGQVEYEALKHHSTELWLDNGSSKTERFSLGKYLKRNNISKLDW